MFLKIFFLSLFFRGRKGGRRSSHEPSLGTWPTTQACALTVNQTGDPLVCRPALNALSYTSRGHLPLFMITNNAAGNSAVRKIQSWRNIRIITLIIPTCLSGAVV